MNVSFTRRGFRVREVVRKESDASLLLFTEGSGSLWAVARGLKRSRKRFPGSVRKLCLYEFLLRREKGGGFSLTGARLLKSYEELATRYEYYLASDYALEIVTKLYPENVDSRWIFRRLLCLLDHFSEKGRIPPALSWMEMSLLLDSGYFPRFDSCSSCGGGFSGDKVYMNKQNLSLLCNKCEKKGVFIVTDRNEVVAFFEFVRSDEVPHGDDFRLLAEKYGKVVRGAFLHRLGYLPRALKSLENIAS
ncbi:MAG: DNA repair protein RecO [Deltaproteobacteria bacterium]|nr:MAG: DNA repair protein RecO [Deltaproteobacteria bacterium]